ncbi:hypothetical protein HMPREF0083_00451 [Aneurinibacillus aneurinilyticus ATCC 12856]|uniref:Uncharacterized protein n=1 Tax=Aneurinibacillus aneurinilyticus ATCC 12856 TaxID=649747 RepID=U1WS76_ANEAE|nr:hypothetical protein HMPREF0083_00451 [Aneurinibacillus aneurinilyticus ATCC 12856]
MYGNGSFFQRLIELPMIPQRQKDSKQDQPVVIPAYCDESHPVGKNRLCDKIHCTCGMF